MKTATNPETGETVVLVGDQWQKAEKIATGSGGSKAYLVDGKWLTDQPQPGQGVVDWLREAPYKAGGAVTDLAAKALPPEVAGAAGYVANVATQAVPALFGGQAAKSAAPALEATAEHLMQSALKPKLQDLKTGKAAKAIQTMLDEGINVSGGGMEKLRGKIGELNQQITDAIASSPATVNKAKVVESLREPLRDAAYQANPQGDMATIKEAWDKFLNHPLLKNLDEIPVQLAQKIKQGTYKAIGEKSYGEEKASLIEAQKTLARGLKEGIADAVPGISSLNAKEGELLNALSVAERRALLQLNNNPGGFAWLAHNPKLWAIYMADKSALFKSLAARTLYSGSERIPQAAAGLGIGTAEAFGSKSE